MHSQVLVARPGHGAAYLDHSWLELVAHPACGVSFVAVESPKRLRYHCLAPEQPIHTRRPCLGAAASDTSSSAHSTLPPRTTPCRPRLRRGSPSLSSRGSGG